jgi:hypothetical protein
MKTFALTFAGCLVLLTVWRAPATAYEFRPFAKTSRKAELKDFIPKIDRSENRSNKMFSEQYSFDGKPKCGGDFWFQIVLSNMGVANGRAGLMVHYQPKGGKKIKARRSFDGGQWSSKAEDGHVQLTLGDSWFKGDGATWTGHFVMEEFTAKVTITNSVPSWRPGGGTAYYGTGENSYYDVTLLTPRGTFVAEVLLKDATEPLHMEGLVYGDHSAMNLAPNNQARRWVKMRVVNSRYTLLLNTFETPEQYEQKWAGWFLVATDSAIVVTALNPSIQLHETELDSGSGYHVPKIVILSDAQGVSGFNGVLKASKRTAREDKLADLSRVERAVVSKIVKPFAFKFKGEFEFVFDVGGSSKTYNGKGNFAYEQMIP